MLPRRSQRRGQYLSAITISPLESVGSMLLPTMVTVQSDCLPVRMSVHMTSATPTQIGFTRAQLHHTEERLAASAVASEFSQSETRVLHS